MLKRFSIPVCLSALFAMSACESTPEQQIKAPSAPPSNSYNKQRVSVNERSIPTIGQIEVKYTDGRISRSSGVLIGRNIVVTNDHVVEDSDGNTLEPEQVTFYAGRSKRNIYNASSTVEQIIAYDPKITNADGKIEIRMIGKDLAYLVLTQPLGDIVGYEEIATSFPQKDSDGQYIGSSYGYNLKDEKYGLTADINCTFYERHQYRNVLETDCNFGPGSSGGPLFGYFLNNSTGQYERKLVGINSASYVDESTGQAKRSFAVSIVGLRPSKFR